MAQNSSEPETAKYSFEIDRETWEEWKGFVSRNKNLDVAVVELIEKDIQTKGDR